MVGNGTMTKGLSRDQLIGRIDDFLAGRTSAEEVSDWALEVFRELDMSTVPENVLYGVHLVADLHDTGEPWCPSADELRECRQLLLENGDIPAGRFQIGRLKSLSRRGRLKELGDLAHRIREGNQ